MKIKALAAVVLLTALGAGTFLAVQYTRRVSQQLTSAPGTRPKLTSIKDPATVPQLVLRTLDGRTLDSDDWKGKVVLVNFWATWCPPCREEIPDLIRLQDRYRAQLLIIGVSSDTGPTDMVARFAA